ncbi:MAG: type III pantothenate kinase [Clostridia bacterium]|nr:type III pantothenate kinase [Clostridia bacterium]
MQVILTVNIGNGSVSFAVYEKGQEPRTARPLSVFRIAALPARTADEYAALLSAMIARLHRELTVETVVLSSVVPALVGEIRGAVWMLFPHATVLTVGAGLKTGMTIRTDSPADLGADLVAVAVGAAALQPPPFLVLDCNAVTTLSAVGAGKDSPAFLGCAILSGPALSAEALKAKAALLPDVLLTAPKAAIGTNSADSVRAGLLFGHAAAIEGLITRFEGEMGGEPLPLIVTGEGADALLSVMKRQTLCDKELVHRGLYKMAVLNERKSGNPRQRG